MKALNSQGFQVISQKGSHIKMKKKTPDKTLVVIVLDHPEILAGILR
ncbi:MAG TPA: type II toxin-antitoxin system HicA family toxin [Methanosarcina sp.]|nr:type II toxin-antitoxin system HicA family toxin [Methanosarcina sp.]